MMLIVLPYFQNVYTRERFYELDIHLERDDLKKCRVTAINGELLIELKIPQDSPSIDFKVCTQR